MARLPSLALSGDDLTGAAAPGSSPWAQTSDTPVLPAAGIIPDPNVMWLDPGLLMEPGTGFGSAQKQDALGQAMDDASGFLQPRGSGGGGGGGPQPPPGGGQAGAGGLAGDIGGDAVKKAGSLFGNTQAPGFGGMDYHRIGMATSPEAFDAMNAMRRAQGAPEFSHYFYDDRLGMAMPSVGAPVGIESFTPGQLPGGFSQADLFDPFPAGATTPSAGAGMAGSISNWSSGAGALLAALGMLIGGDAGRALSLAGTGASAVGSISGAAGGGAAAGGTTVAGAGTGGAGTAAGSTAGAAGLGSALAGLSAVAALPALGMALHPFFYEAGMESTKDRNQRRNTTVQSQLMGGLGKAMTETDNLGELLALAGAGPNVGQGQIQFTHDKYGFGGDYRSPMSDAWMPALIDAANNEQTLRDFIGGINIKTGHTGATSVNDAMTDLYRRELAHAGGLTDVEGLFGPPLDPEQLTRYEMERLSHLPPTRWGDQGYETDWDAVRGVGKRLSTKGVTRAYQPMGEQYGPDLWTPVSPHYREPGELDADMAQIQALLSSVDPRAQQERELLKYIQNQVG